jgi:hypothetical protein
VQPESFDEELMTDWSLWVLDHGLPVLPDRVEVGQSVPVARWAGPRFGAVMHVQWSWGCDDEDDALINEVEVFARHQEGWCPSSGSGGSGWFDPPFQRPASLGPHEAYAIGQHCSGADGWYCCAVDGLAGGDAAFVEVEDADGTTRRPIESPFGAFVACSDGQHKALIRVLDASARVLFEGELGWEW